MRTSLHRVPRGAIGDAVGEAVSVGLVARGVGLSHDAVGGGVSQGEVPEEKKMWW